MRINYQKELGEKTKSFDLQIIKGKECYTIKCLNKDDVEMGFVTFKIYNDILWIYKLETNSKFYRQGVASAIVDITEFFAIKHGANRVEGKFFPTNEYARPFYEKNGYFVPNKVKSWDNYDPCWIMYKVLNPKEITQKVAPNIKAYKYATINQHAKQQNSIQESALCQNNYS